MLNNVYQLLKQSRLKATIELDPQKQEVTVVVTNSFLNEPWRMAEKVIIDEVLIENSFIDVITIAIKKLIERYQQRLVVIQNRRVEELKRPGVYIPTKTPTLAERCKELEDKWNSFERWPNNKETKERMKAVWEEIGKISRVHSITFVNLKNYDVNFLN